MNVTEYALTDVGRQREHNEDNMLADPVVGLYVVCDGMGGHNAGEVASEMTCKTVHRVAAEMRGTMRAVAEGKAPMERLVSLVRLAVETGCREVYDAAQEDAAKKGMGCTCTSVLVCGGKAVLGHVGDSRLYLSRGGKTTQLSEDHTFLAEAVKQGMFTPAEAAESPYGNVITRAIGIQRSVIVDTLVFDVTVGDTILLCSDGLHGYTKDLQELEALLSADDAESIPKLLIDLANERGGHDNITAIVLRAGSTEANAGASEKRRGDVQKNIEALRHIELMRELTLAETMRFSQVFQEQSYEAGSAMVREGEVSDKLFVLVEGKAEVWRNEERLAVLKSGSHFGEMAVLNSRPRSATVRAVEPCRMLVVDRARLYNFLPQDGILAAKFFWKLAETLSRRLGDVYAKHEQQLGEVYEALAAATTGSEHYPSEADTVKVDVQPEDI